MLDLQKSNIRTSIKQTISKISFHSFGDLGPHFFFSNPPIPSSFKYPQCGLLHAGRKKTTLPRVLTNFFDAKKIRCAHWPNRTEAENYSILVNLSDTAFS